MYEYELWQTIPKCKVETQLKRRYLTSWVVALPEPLSVSRLQSQGCVWTPDCFFSAHTERKASGPRGDILWIWPQVYWIRIADYTFQELISPAARRTDGYLYSTARGGMEWNETKSFLFLWSWERRRFETHAVPGQLGTSLASSWPGSACWSQAPQRLGEATVMFSVGK